MNNYISERAQEEICEEIIKRYAGIYYSYKPVDIVGVAKYLGLDVRYVTFCDDLVRLGFYSDGKTAVNILTKNGPISKIFPKNTILISDRLKGENHRNRLRFTLAHETTHHIKALMTGEEPEAAFMTEIEYDDKISVEQMKKIMSCEERMADKGAAALLMPRKLVVNTCRSIMDDKPIIVYGKNNFDEDTISKLQEIADFMQVSLTALMIRLKSLRLLEKHSIEEFKGFVNIVGGVLE